MPSSFLCDKVVVPIWHSVRALPELSQVIRVPEAFVFQEGARVTEDLVAGKLLGDGVQGQVYVLKRPDGSSTDQLLKASVPFFPLWRSPVKASRTLHHPDSSRWAGGSHPCLCTRRCEACCPARRGKVLHQ